MPYLPELHFSELETCKRSTGAECGDSILLQSHVHFSSLYFCQWQYGYEKQGDLSYQGQDIILTDLVALGETKPAFRCFAFVYFPFCNADATTRTSRMNMARLVSFSIKQLTS